MAITFLIFSEVKRITLINYEMKMCNLIANKRQHSEVPKGFSRHWKTPLTAAATSAPVASNSARVNCEKPPTKSATTMGWTATRCFQKIRPWSATNVWNWTAAKSAGCSVRKLPTTNGQFGTFSTLGTESVFFDRFCSFYCFMLTKFD